MNNNNNSNISWLNVVIIKEFQNCLDLGSVKELSLVSKLFRLKLSPKLFNIIKLDIQSNPPKGNLEKHFNVREITVLNKFVKSGLGDLKYMPYIDKLLNNIKDNHQSIKSYVSSLKFRALGHIGYFMFPVFKCFENLEILDLHYCTIPYSMLIKSGDLFPKLKEIRLYDVILVKLPTDRAHSEDYSFPHNLSSLDIKKVTVTEQDDSFDPYERLHNDYFLRDSYIFTIPRIALPNLLKLKTDGDDEDDNYLEEFSKINPNLESLNAEFIFLDRKYNFKSLKSLEINYVECFDSKVKFTSQDNLNELNLLVEGDDYFENVSKLCLLCPNIAKLYLCLVCIDDFQEAFDSFLIPILSNLPKLKTLELELVAEEDEILDINNFPHIEKLIISSGEPNILNFRFGKNRNLKTLEFKCQYFDDEIYKNDFRKLKRKTKNWKFTHSNSSIIGYKLSQ